MTDPKNSAPVSQNAGSGNGLVFPVPAPIALHLALYASAAVLAGLMAWLVRGGMYTSAAVLAIIFVPLGGMLFYSLVVVPGRATIQVSAQGVSVQASPFVQTCLQPGFSVQNARLNDPAYEPKDRKVRQGLFMGPYKAGSFELKNGGTAVLLTRGKNVLHLTDGETHLLLGPSDLAGLEEALGAE